jgi:hypothetical protein
VAVNALYDRCEMNVSAEIYPMQAGIAPAVSSARGSVCSVDDAIAISAALWDEMSELPAARLIDEGRASS